MIRPAVFRIPSGSAKDSAAAAPSYSTAPLSSAHSTASAVLLSAAVDARDCDGRKLSTDAVTRSRARFGMSTKSSFHMNIARHDRGRASLLRLSTKNRRDGLFLTIKETPTTRTKDGNWVNAVARLKLTAGHRSLLRAGRSNARTGIRMYTTCTSVAHVDAAMRRCGVGRLGWHGADLRHANRQSAFCRCAHAMRSRGLSTIERTRNSVIPSRCTTGLW